jgi:hypothetical protein
MVDAEEPKNYGFLSDEISSQNVVECVEDRCSVEQYGDVLG